MRCNEFYLQCIYWFNTTPHTHTKTSIAFKKTRGLGFCNYFLCSEKGWIHADPLRTSLKQFIIFQWLNKLQWEPGSQTSCYSVNVKGYVSWDLTLSLTFLAATISEAVSHAVTSGKSRRQPDYISSLLELNRRFVLWFYFVSLSIELSNIQKKPGKKKQTRRDSERK